MYIYIYIYVYAHVCVCMYVCVYIYIYIEREISGGAVYNMCYISYIKGDHTTHIVVIRITITQEIGIIDSIAHTIMHYVN